MNSSHALAGVLPVIQTPFTEDDEIDRAVLQKEIDWVLGNGCHGVVVAMVSEVMRLEGSERRRLGEWVCEHTGGRGVVVLSVGAESHRTARSLARHAQAAGADAVMAIPPVLTRLDENSLLAYYEGILAATDLPVIVQDASGYLGRQIPVAIQARLLALHPDRILFKPEAAPIGPTLGRLLAATDGKARVFEGTGGIALIDSYHRGIVGTMPAADVCWALTALWSALVEGDEDRADLIAGPLSRMISFQTELDLFVAVEKYLLMAQGIFPNEAVRGPSSFEWDNASRREIDHCFSLLRTVVAEGDHSTVAPSRSRSDT